MTCVVATIASTASTETSALERKLVASLAEPRLVSSVLAAVAAAEALATGMVTEMITEPEAMSTTIVSAATPLSAAAKLRAISSFLAEP